MLIGQEELVRNNYINEIYHWMESVCRRFNAYHSGTYLRIVKRLQKKAFFHRIPLF